MCFGVFKKFKASKEDELNSKYPKCVVVYDGRTIPNYGFYALDVRAFFVNPASYELQEITKTFGGGSDDNKALQCLLWVIDHTTYVSDKIQHKLEEFWMYPSETLKTRKGDCDDGAILLANLMLVAGIPYWKIRLTAGMVPEGGHAYVTYYYEGGDYWVALDWCYYPNRKPIAERPDYKNSKIYREVWFSWNKRFAFMKGVKED